MKCKLVLAAAVAAMACSAVFAAGRTMLAVPARHDMVGFGFDMLRQLPDNLELACYKGEDRIELLEVFDRAAREWRTISTETWAAGIWRASSLVIAGENKAAADLSSISGWAKQIKMPSDRAKLDVVNAVNSFQPLTEKQWKSLGATYGFTFVRIVQPSSRERRRDAARARREAARIRREEERRQREVEKTIEHQRQLMKRQQNGPRPQTEVVPAPAPVVSKPVPAPAPVEVKPAPVLPESKLPEAQDIVFKRRDPAEEGKVAEIKAQKTNIPEVKVPEAKPSEVKPTEAEAKVKTAVEAAVSEAAAKAPKADVTPVPAPATVEVRVPAREAVAPKTEAPAVPVSVSETSPAKLPDVKPVEVAVPEVKVPAAKPVEVAAPEVKVPEVKPVQTPEIKVPAIVLDPM